MNDAANDNAPEKFPTEADIQKMAEFFESTGFDPDGVTYRDHAIAWFDGLRDIAKKARPELFDDG